MRTAILLPFCALPFCALAACHLVDQRDFDKHAGDRPSLPAGPPARVAPPVPALVTIRYDVPDPPYREALATAVSHALARKHDVIFTVTTLVPPSGGPAEQAAAEGAASVSGRDVAAAIVADGADPGQVEQTVRQEASLKVREVRVDVH
jgi:hypothetical protein